MGCRAVAVPVTGDGIVFAGPTTLYGFSLLDTSAAANTVTIYDGTSAAGTILFHGEITASTPLTFSISGGVHARLGLYIDLDGAVTGSVWVG